MALRLQFRRGRGAAIRIAIAIAIAAALFPLSAAFAGEEGELVRTLEGNSFLLEEAYNLEEGHVAHTASFVRNRATGAWMASAAQDWAVDGEAHQLGWAATLGHPGPGGTGLGDAAINYRYQLLSDDAPVALAPRLSVLLPAGDPRRGLGSGGLGLLVNLPVSARLSGALAWHANLGGSNVPAGRDGDGDAASLWSLSAGQGLVLAVHRNLNLLVEGQWTTTFKRSPGRVEREDVLLLSPGLRAGGEVGSTVVVVGAAAPFRVGPGGGVALLAYVSLDFPFRQGSPAAPPGGLPRGAAEVDAPPGPVLASH